MLPRWLRLAPLFFLSGPLGAAPLINLLDYGAHPDGSAPSTEAFRSAIQAAHAAGGGTVLVPPGTYLTGPIELVSNLVLDLEAGATLRFPAQRLPFTQGREQGIECLTPVPLIGGRNLENVTITGRGVLTTSNADWLKLMGRSKASGEDPGTAFGPNWEKLLASLERHTPAPRAEYLAAAPELRPSFVRFMDCRNVLVEGVHFEGSSMWTIHLLYTDNAVVRDVIIETYPGVHTDGIGVDSSRNVRISDCYIDTGDDGIVIKSGKDADGRRVNRPTENVSIANCTVHHAHGAVTIGSETSGGVHNVVADNITCDGTQEGIRIKSRRGRGGVVEDLRFDNWTMRHVGVGIDVTSFYLMEGERPSAPEPVSVRTPVFRNIAIANVTIDRARKAVDIEGLPEMPIQGLRLTDVVARAQVGLTASRADALELRGVRIDSDRGPAFALKECADPDVDDISSQKPPAGEPVLRLARCAGAVVRNCRAYPGTGAFLETGPGELARVALVGDALGLAARGAAEQR